MSSLTFFLILILILAFILPGINILPFPPKSPALVMINLQSFSNLCIFIFSVVWSNRIYSCISPSIHNNIVFSSSYIIRRITIDLQSDYLDPLLNCIHRELPYKIIKCLIKKA